MVCRDLSKPIGALNPVRLEKEFIPKYQSLLHSTDPPPHHYGSHYSLSGTVTGFMLRQQPFTAMAKELQGGKFDAPDR